jgi:hypothetical protein
MHVPQIRVAILTGSLITIVACGGAARRQATPAGPPPEVLKALEVPPSPYYLIYSPPVSLAKPPDTTAHARKPRS